MSNRCPDCNKFVSLETQDAEENDTNFDPDSGELTASYRLVRSCMDCGGEMKEATFDVSGDMSDLDDAFWQSHTGHTLSEKWNDPEVMESGGGRYQANEFSLSVDVEITCDDCNEATTVTLTSDTVRASDFDDLN